MSRQNTAKMFEKLNLPPFDIRLSRLDDGSVAVYDPLRHKEVVLTPEEWVRQHFVNYLTAHRGYPAAFMANEVGLKLNGTQRRCDTVVYHRDLSVACIVEYKRPTVEITAKVFNQIARYNSVLGAPYLIVSNGLRHFCVRYENEAYTWLQQIPAWEEM